MRAPKTTRLAIALAAAASCRPDSPALIGDAFPRSPDASAFLDAILPSIESQGVRVERWSIGEDRAPTIELNSEQAIVFAENPAVVGIVGHGGSRDALLGATVYNLHGVPQVVPNATSRRLSTAGPWTFTLVPNDSVEGAFLATFASDSLGAQRVVVFYLGDEYGIGLRDGVSAAIRSRGHQLADAVMVPAGACHATENDAAFSAIASAAVRRTQPDVVVLATGVSGWCTADVVHRLSPSTWILCADGLDGCHDVPTWATQVRRDRVRGVEYWTPGTDSLNRAFVDAVVRQTRRTPTSADALQFDAYLVLSAAVRDVGPNRRAIRDWLSSLGRGRPPVQGVTGPIAFNAPRSSILRMSDPVRGAP